MGGSFVNNNVLVRNVRGTSDRKCRCGSWLLHWDNETKSNRATCSVVPCGNDATLGAHVQILDNRTSGQHWIVPMCDGHNRLDDDLWLDGRVTLVSANRQKMGCY